MQLTLKEQTLKAVLDALSSDPNAIFSIVNSQETPESAKIKLISDIINKLP